MKQTLYRSVVATDMTFLALFGVLSEFIKNYIWSDPQAIWFMFICYHLNLAFDLYWLFEKGQLSRREVLSRILKVQGNVTGAFILLYVSTNLAKYSPAYFWLPQSSYAILMGALCILILKQASRLGIISPAVYRLIEYRATRTQEKLKHGSDHDEAEPLPGQVLEGSEKPL